MRDAAGRQAQVGPRVPGPGTRESKIWAARTVGASLPFVHGPRGL